MFFVVVQTQFADNKAKLTGNYDMITDFRNRVET